MHEHEIKRVGKETGKECRAGTRAILSPLRQQNACAGNFLRELWQSISGGTGKEAAKAEKESGARNCDRGDYCCCGADGNSCGGTDSTMEIERGSGDAANRFYGGNKCGIEGEAACNHRQTDAGGGSIRARDVSSGAGSVRITYSFRCCAGRVTNANIQRGINVRE